MENITELDVLNLISSVAETEVSNLGGETRFDDICGWDSLSWVKLSPLLKQEFGYDDLIEDVEDIISIKDLIEKIL